LFEFRDLPALLEGLRRLYGRLRLKVKETKSAVASVFGRKFLGYSLWVASGSVVKRKVATKALVAFKHRIRELTGRSGGRSMKDVVERLRPYVLGWKACFRLAQTPRVWLALDKWMRHRPRAIQLKNGAAVRPSTGNCVRWEHRLLWHNRWRLTAVAGGVTAASF
jgi:hypothetical protein